MYRHDSRKGHVGYPFSRPRGLASLSRHRSGLQGSLLFLRRGAGEFCRWFLLWASTDPNSVA